MREKPFVMTFVIPGTDEAEIRRAVQQVQAGVQPEPHRDLPRQREGHQLSHSGVSPDRGRQAEL